MPALLHTRSPRRYLTSLHGGFSHFAMPRRLNSPAASTNTRTCARLYTERCARSHLSCPSIRRATALALPHSCPSAHTLTSPPSCQPAWPLIHMPACATGHQSTRQPARLRARQPARQPAHPPAPLHPYLLASQPQCGARWCARYLLHSQSIVSLPACTLANLPAHSPKRMPSCERTSAPTYLQAHFHADALMCCRSLLARPYRSCLLM